MATQQTLQKSRLILSPRLKRLPVWEEEEEETCVPALRSSINTKYVGSSEGNIQENNICFLGSSHSICLSACHSIVSPSSQTCATFSLYFNGRIQPLVPNVPQICVIFPDQTRQHPLQLLIHFSSLPSSFVA